MVLGNLACITHCSTIVIPGESFEPRATLTAVHEERCTSLYGVPTMFIAELHDPGFSSFDLSSLRTGIMAGAPCPVEVMRRLCTRGYSVMLGYWDDDEATRQAIDEARWMHTGDLAVMADDGYVSIVGRIKDMIIRAGENVYPREIEEFLHQHPLIEDAQVVGIPDPRYGEQVCAWIIKKHDTDLNADEIRDYCRREITRYKVPEYIRFVESFPLTVTGKVQKYRIREEELRLRGLAARSNEHVPNPSEQHADAPSPGARAAR
jgi:acyl-CoA synthetase (AMP-forming)/AMP-acid ligase II